MNSLDQAAKNHDQSYDIVNGKGVKGAVYDLATLPADKQLVQDAKNVAEMYKKKTIDPVTNQLISPQTEITA